MSVDKAIILLGVYELGWVSGVGHIRMLTTPGGPWWLRTLIEVAVIVAVSAFGLAVVRWFRRS